MAIVQSVSYTSTSSPLVAGRFLLPEWRKALTQGWSSNLTNNSHNTVLERTFANSDFASYYAAPGQDPAGVVVASNTAFAYSSGCYVGGSVQAYYFTGGGHNDWLGSEVAKFDLRTLTWSRTDESAKLRLGTNDPTAPLSPTEQFGWKAWRNPSGRYAPLSSHTYGGLTYLPSLNKIHVLSGAPYRSGAGSVGGSMGISVPTGHWDETLANPGMLAASAECMSYTIPSVTLVNSSLVPTGEVWGESVFHVWSAGYPNCRLVNPVTKQVVTPLQYNSTGWRGTCAGCVIPDPDFPERLAYVVDRNTTTFTIMSRIDMARTDGQPHDSFKSRAYSNAKPVGVGDGSRSRWIYMGQYFPGNTKIAVYVPTAGLFVLDSSTWTWGDQITGTATGGSSTGEIWKRFEYIPEYRAFGLWSSGSFYVLPLPEELR